jgi:serine/threonine protein kinase
VISIGDKLNDTYRVKRRLGGGGFGEVFLADDEKIPSRKVAIKVLARPGDTDQSDLLWEMRTLAQFNNRHVVAFYHHFTDGDRLYLVMEFCPGGSLADRLAKSGHCSVDQVFAWGVQLCDTLALVHGEGIVHHDIKPHNILFGADGTIKLGDFGIANRNGGTLLYMPPEMLLGDPVERTSSLRRASSSRGASGAHRPPVCPGRPSWLGPGGPPQSDSSNAGAKVSDGAGLRRSSPAPPRAVPGGWSKDQG